MKEKLYNMTEVVEILQNHKPIRKIIIDWSKGLCNNSTVMPVIEVEYVEVKEKV